ncbi:hypothetical protein [Nocardioides sp. SYSU DS0663]|uniref:hypothetical protein n=1 Tax=Nocardioides sp. SYSU DS0663 TaxID=3416445 RepID=UPI003F4BCB97
MPEDDRTTDTGSGDLAPKPEPEIEPGEPEPGGADAIEDPGGRAIPDLTPDQNPAIEDKTPADLREQMSGSEDTSTDATDASGEDAGAQDTGSAEEGKAG